MAEGLVINTNFAASSASATLSSTAASLQKSLVRLSSGFKINSPKDDAGGMAVSMKIEAAIKRNIAARNNIGNAISFLQTQDGAMDTVARVVQRVSELKLLIGDETKSSSDKSNYETEFDQLKSQLINLQAEKFNGVSIFSNSSSTFNVITSDDGSQSVAVHKADINSAISNIVTLADLTDLTVGDTTSALDTISTLRATNGAEANRLEFASGMLESNKINLESANSRIKDTDTAAESTAFAKFSILMQSGTAMLAQANTVPQVALRLLS